MLKSVLVINIRFLAQGIKVSSKDGKETDGLGLLKLTVLQLTARWPYLFKLMFIAEGNHWKKRITDSLNKCGKGWLAGATVCTFERCKAFGWDFVNVSMKVGMKYCSVPEGHRWGKLLATVQMTWDHVDFSWVRLGTLQIKHPTQISIISSWSANQSEMAV